MDPPFDREVHIRSPDITPGMIESITEVRKSLEGNDLFGQYATWCSDEIIVLFLIARQCNVKQAVDLLASALKWRITRVPSDGGIESTEGWEARMSKEGETGKIYVPGYDKWERPVVIFDNSVQNTKSADDQQTFLAWNLEYACKMMPKTVDKYLIFMHLEVFSLFNCPSISVVKETIFMLCSGYPERLGHCICYRPPAVFKTVFNAIKGLIDPKTVSKLIFITGDVSDGSENDLKLRELIGDNWKILTGAEQPVVKTGCSPGYDHSQYWPMAMARLQNILSRNDEAEVENEGASRGSVEALQGSEVEAQPDTASSSEPSLPSPPPLVADIVPPAPADP